jgi:hypothetical protein
VHDVLVDLQPQPGNQTQFESNADRAREHARVLAAEGIADQVERDRRADDGTDRPGPLMGFVDRIRSVLRSIRGD